MKHFLRTNDFRVVHFFSPVLCPNFLLMRAFFYVVRVFFFYFFRNIFLTEMSRITRVMVGILTDGGQADLERKALGEMADSRNNRKTQKHAEIHSSSKGLSFSDPCLESRGVKRAGNGNNVRKLERARRSTGQQ